MGVVEALPKVLKNPLDLEARSVLSQISLLALSGYMDAGRGGGFPIHWLEHSLSAHYDIPHGRGLAVLLPRVVEYTIPANPERYARLAKMVFGPYVVGTGRSNLEAALIFYQELVKWMDSVQMATSLSDLGIDDSLFSKMADDALHLYGKGRDYLENPRKISRKEIVEIFSRALGPPGV